MINQVTLDRASRRKDGSIALTFITSLEVLSDEFTEMDKTLNTTGILYFKSDGSNLTQKEIDAIDSTKLKVEGKSKSARLRNTLYVYWKQLDSSKTFEEYYSDEMERIITHYKGKLD